MRGIPGITIVSPADCAETMKVALAAVNHHESIYIRLTGGAGNPPVYEDDYEFQIGKAVTLREGGEVTIIACGTMVHASLQAADILNQSGISTGVINMHTIKPIDKDAVEKACRTSNLIVTVEEHNMIGGLGAAVAEHKATLRNTPPQLFIGLPDNHGKAGEYKDLLEKYGLTAQHIARQIVDQIAPA